MLMNSYKNLIPNFNKNIFVLGFGIIIKLLIVVLNSRVITYYLDDSNLADFYLILTIIAFFSLGFINPLSIFFTKYLFVFHKKNHLLNAFYFLFKKFLLIPLILYSSILTFYFSIKEFEYFLIFILISYVLTRSLNDTLSSVFNLIERNTRFIFITNLNLLLSLTLSFLFIKIFEVNYLNWFFGIVVTQFIILFIGLKLYYDSIVNDSINQNHEVFNPKSYNFSSKNYYLFVITNFAGWFFVEGYKLFFDFYLEDGTLINFFIGFILGSQIISTVETFNQQLNTPKYLQIANESNEKISHSFLVLLRKSFIVLVIALIVFLLCHKIILNILVDSSKINDQVFYYFKIGLLYATLNALLNIFRLFFMSVFEIKKIFISNTVGIITFLILFFLRLEFNFAYLLIISLLSSKIVLMFFYLTYKPYKIPHEL